MSFLKIEMVGDAEVKARLKAMPQRVLDEVSAQMRLSWLDLQGYIVKSKLAGQVLARRTGVLANSINAGDSRTASAFEQSPLMITGVVGTRVWYGAIHENGGTFGVRAYTRTMDHVFGRKVSPFEQHVPAHSATYPERSFLRSGLADRSDQIRKDIEQAVAKALKE